MKKELLASAPWRGEEKPRDKFADAKLWATNEPGGTPTMHVPRKKSSAAAGDDYDGDGLDIDPELRYSFQRNFRQLAYEYAKRRANLVLVARREQRLWGIRENARILGAKHVLVMAADVVKEEDCRKFITDTISYFGHINHLVNAASLGHNFYFEEAIDTSVFPHMMDINFWGNVYPTYVALPYLRQTRGRVLVNASVESWLPMPKMSLYAAAKAAVINFYESLRFEVKDDVGITIATHGWMGNEVSRRRFMLEEGGAGQWKEEREVPMTGGQAEDFARMMVAAACRGDAYAKHPTWHDIFLLVRVLAPDVIGWTFRLLLSNHEPKRVGRPLLEAPAPRPLLEATSPRKGATYVQSFPQRQQIAE